MENEVKDIDSVNYINTRVSFGEDEVREFVTDAELVEQFKELERLQRTQKILWRESRMTHVAIPETQKKEVTMLGNMSRMFNNVNNSSRTKNLNSSSIVNTTMPLMGRNRVRNRNYNNMGRMW